MNRNARIALVVAALVAAGVLFAVLGSRDSDDSGSKGEQAATRAHTTVAGTTATATTEGEVARAGSFTLVVRDGKPVAGVKQLEVTRGDRVKLLVRSDVGGEVHVHGYELEKEVPAGGSVTFDFPAKLEGVFKIELHGPEEEEIASLQVSPS